MPQIQIQDRSGQEVQRHSIEGGEFTIGRSRKCDVRISGWRVGKQHAYFVLKEDGWQLSNVSGGFSVLVNGHEVEDSHGPLKPGDSIEISEFTVQIDLGAAENVQDHLEPGNQHEAAGDVGRGFDGIQNASEQAEERLFWRGRIHRELLSMMDLRRLDISGMSAAELREFVRNMIDEIIAKLGVDMPSRLDRVGVANEVLSEAVGYGPLDDLIADESVTEIMVNAFDDIYAEQGGRLRKLDMSFSSNEAVLAIIDRIVAPLGRRIDESSPMVDARLPDGSRVNAIIPPLAIRGPSITIRKFSKKRLRPEDLEGFGSATADMLSFLSVAVRERKNIIISGGTGSGKTTLLNILSNYIPETERIVTVEDSAELRLNQPHVVSLEARPKNIEGKGAIPIRDLVRNTLRMRPDRIVVGECRGGEALDMLQAMNTGHDGSLTTVHANSPRDMVSRLEVMVMMAGMDLPSVAIREQIASAVQIIVQQKRFFDGTRRIVSVSEVTGMENTQIQLQEIFGYRQQGVDEQGRVKGNFYASGAIPEFYEELSERGIGTDLSIFRSAS
jgi:pilus assembly protein CpaF